MSKRSKTKFEFSSFAKAVALIVLALIVAVLCILAIRHGRGNQQVAITQTDGECDSCGRSND